MMTRSKKLQAPIISIILLSLVLYFAAFNLAGAANELIAPPKPASSSSIIAGAGKTVAQYAVGAFGAVGAALLGVIAHFTNLGGAFFDLSLSYNLDLRDKLVSVHNGWVISRDIANLFFILILLGISIATILRVSAYQAKELLPRLIIIALLINFSFSIGLIIIDFTNILGKQFYDVITENGAKRVSEIIMQNAKVQAVFDDRDADLAAQTTWLQRMFKTLIRYDAFGPVGQLWLQLTHSAGNDLDQALIFAKLSWGSLILLAVITFVFFVGGIILLIRPAILALLLALAPIAFLFYILPDTESHWKKWWSTLINHSFFLPSFLFLLYIAILLINNISAGLPSGSALNNAPLVFNYILSITLLIAALILGKSMGVYGANTAMALATTGRKWLTGAVGGLAARYTTGVLGTAIAPAAAKFQETRFGQVFGTAPTKFAGWLKGLGGAEKRAEAMADFAKQLTPERQAKYFAGLGAQEKVALLGKMTETQQNAMMQFMSPAERALAEGIIKRQMPPAAAAKFDLEAWKRQTFPEQRRQMEAWLTPGTTYNPDLATDALRGMNDEEKAGFIDRLGVPGTPARTSAESVISSRFTPKEQQGIKVAGISRKSESEQAKAFTTEFNADDREVFLRKKDAKGQARFIDGFNKPVPPGIAATDWGAAKTAAESIVQTRFSAGEQRAYKEAAIENITQKSLGAIKLAAATMSDEELDILQKVGDENKISQLINDFGGGADTEKAIAKKVGQNIVKRGQESKYLNLLQPRAYIESVIENDPVEAAKPYEEKLKNYFAKVDAKVLRRNLSPEIIKQTTFVEDILAAGTMEDISLIAGDTRRAAAFKEGLATVLGISATASAQETAEKLAKSNEAKNNSILLREIDDYLKTPSLAYKEVVKSILEGRAQPQVKTP